MKAEVRIAVLEVTKDVSEIIKDWCDMCEVGDEFVKRDTWSVDDRGNITAVFNDEVDTLPIEELRNDLVSDGNSYEARFEDVKYVGNGRYLCRQRRDVSSEGVVVEIDDKIANRRLNG